MRVYFGVLLASCLLLSVVNADMYLHNPPGSNDRNRERNDNRDNGDRLFDSQNNGKGGYAWRGDPNVQSNPDPLVYYTGSVLRMEWTNQHACGVNPNTACDVIVQYACDTINENQNKAATRSADLKVDMPGLRDGYPSSESVVQSDNQNAGYTRREFSGEAGQNDRGTNTIPANQFQNDPVKRAQFYVQGMFGGVEFGMHEGYDLYNTCRNTARNNGLYTADQKLNGNDARFTRQNPNGARRGLECPEERDYYPYWVGNLNPWNDVAVLTNNMSRCDYFVANSPNVKAYGYCSNWTGTGNIPIRKDDCVLNQKGIWNDGAPKGLAAPDCLLHSYARDNHLGNVAPIDPNTGLPVADKFQPEMAGYMLTIPEAMANKRCILRVRYNMSTLDYPSIDYSLQGGTIGVGINSSKNCANVVTADGDNVDALSQTVSNAQCIQNLLTDTSRPLTNRPYVSVFGNTTSKLSIALNTNQAGRTFQDRSYVFDVRPSPVSGRVFNINVRGRRGNIVQCYPAVEYDFVPNRLEVNQGDYVHFQIHGSDFNEAKNANNGEGWQYSDRSNIVQYVDPAHNIPAPRSQITMFPDLNTAQRWALLDQDPATCQPFKNGDANEQNNVANCGKLNRAARRFPATTSDGLMEISQAAGTYYYGSTRNNNFSNRSQKAWLVINGGAAGLSVGAAAGIAVGTIAAAGIIVAGLIVYAKKRPNSAVAGCYSKMTSKCSRSTSGSSAPTTSTSSSGVAAPPDMEYRRH